jgi:hypothetical protein
VTLDVPTPVIVTAAIGALVGATGWVVRALVLDRIKALEGSRDKLGERIGAVEKWQEAHDKVEEYAHRRNLTNPHGVPIKGGGE